MKRILSLALVLTIALVLTACGGGGSDKAVETNEANAVDLHIIANNWDFDQEEYVVQANQPINFSLTNEEGYHEYAIKGLGINIKPDEPKQYKITEPGTYTIECSFACGAGHSTMKSKLIVQ